MEWLKKINLKRYFVGSILNLLSSVLIIFSRSQVSDFWMIFLIYVSSILNQALLMAILWKAMKKIEGGDERGAREALVFTLQILGKLAFLGGSFLLVATYARELISYGLFLYTFQLIILIVSIRKRDS
jgi:hypothetical protein